MADEDDLTQDDNDLFFVFFFLRQSRPTEAKTIVQSTHRSTLVHSRQASADTRAMLFEKNKCAIFALQFVHMEILRH